MRRSQYYCHMKVLTLQSFDSLFYLFFFLVQNKILKTATLNSPVDAVLLISARRFILSGEHHVRN